MTDHIEQPQAAQAVPDEIAETMRRALVHFSDCEYEMLKASKKPAVKQTAQQNMNDADAALNWLAAARYTRKDGGSVVPRLGHAGPTEPSP